MDRSCRVSVSGRPIGSGRRFKTKKCKKRIGSDKKVGSDRRSKTKKSKRIGSDEKIGSDGRFIEWCQQQADSMFGRSIKDEKNPEEILKTDECEGFKSQRIIEVGKDEDLENGPEENLKIDPYSDSICYMDGSESFDVYERLHRTWDVKGFTGRYKFVHGEKICISPNVQEPLSCLSDKCFASTWVGVHGMQSICMVICRDMDMTHLTPFYQKDSLKRHNMCMFARGAISEVECLPHKDVNYYDVAFRQLCTGTVKKPFAVVSLGLEESTSKRKKKRKRICGYEDSKHHDSCVDETISFLESVVSSDLLSTHYGIIRVAIKAYQLIMCHKELRADDIWVAIMNCKFGQFDHLPMDIIGEQLDFVNSLSSEKDPRKIGKQLVLVNGLSSEKDTQKPLFECRGALL